MKFLQLCLWLSIAAIGARPMHAQQPALTPEQQQQATDTTGEIS